MYIKIVAVIFVGLFGAPIIFASIRERKDENNNSLEKVNNESKCAIRIIENPPQNMQQALRRVREYALGQVTKDFDTIYYIIL